MDAMLPTYPFAVAEPGFCGIFEWLSCLAHPDAIAPKTG